MTLTAAEEAELAHKYEYLAGQEAGRRQLLDALWATIPQYVLETNYSALLAAGTPLTVRPQFSDLEVIEAIMFSVPQGATALIQLGAIAIPVSQGTGVLSPLGILLAQGDTRSITIASASGPASLTLTGHRLPTTGVMQG